MSTDNDWAEQAQKAAEAHYGKVIDAWFAEQDGAEVQSPATAPYCGCTTCDIREILAGAWPVIEEMLAEERRVTWQMAAITGRVGVRIPAQRGALVALDAPEAAIARGAHETSVDAAVNAAANSASHRLAVVKHLSSAPWGMTDDELEVATGLRHQTVSARRRGLVQDGWVEPRLDEAGQTMKRRTRSGNFAIVWTLTATGKTAWTEKE